MGAGPGASSSPGAQKPWHEGLQGPQGPFTPPLTKGLEAACKEYLHFVGDTPFSKDAFLEGTRLGTQALKEAGGWEEANRAIRKVWIGLKGDHFHELHGSFFEGLRTSCWNEPAQMLVGELKPGTLGTKESESDAGLTQA